ncbi:MAG: DUF898 domain-containing protein [Methylibium sp.]|uniref:YjgN family protein n=1 Tax=Methylibium sp. TaxID=2067992 RepID=UPI0017EBC5A1|nr:YjgN family protein [Methylibium sp.]MBA3599457.1 DUF898 domain-containing protein [Methylibium sp.]
MAESAALPSRPPTSRPVDLSRRHPEVDDYLQPGPRRFSGHAHPLTFSGSGSEYFRIWIVNLLLTLLTLGVYYPWAKVRKLRYFHTNTEIAGHALDFHGEPKKMLRGLVLMAVLLGAYSVAGEVSPTAGTIAFVLLAGVWPALWRASLQFRLANTSWRGLRFRFTGGMARAYGVFALPLAAAVALGVGLAVLLPALRNQPLAAGLLAFGALAAALLLLPYGWLRLKRYQHGHYAYAQQQTELRVALRVAYGAFVRIAGVALLVLIFSVGLLAGLAVLLGESTRALLGLAPVAFVLLLLMVQIVPRAYATSRLQNLLWSRTGNPELRFRSDLHFAPLALLMLKNWLLVLLTLGLYWPWAAIAMARLRLEAVSLHTRRPLDELQSEARAASGDAAGDAAADLLGIDLGL